MSRAHRQLKAQKFVAIWAREPHARVVHLSGDGQSFHRERVLPATFAVKVFDNRTNKPGREAGLITSQIAGFRGKENTLGDRPCSGGEISSEGCLLAIFRQCREAGIAK